MGFISRFLIEMSELSNMLVCVYGAKFPLVCICSLGGNVAFVVLSRSFCSV